MADLLYRVSLQIVPRFFVGLTRIWFATCKLEVVGEDHLKAALAQGAVAAAFWHYSFAYLFHHLRKYKAAVMVSASKDGEYIARVAEIMGHLPLRGSSNRGGVRALKAMIKQLAQGRHCAIVADGSQGPARKLQAGCILLASKSGKPVLPIVWACSKFFSFNSWDKTVVPFPFSKITLHYGEPFYVPENISSEQLEEYRQQLEQRLNNLYSRAWNDVGREKHDEED